MKKYLLISLAIFLVATMAYGAARTVRYIPSSGNLILTETDNAGYIGIGTTSPAEHIHSYTSSGYNTLRIDSGATKGQFFSNSSSNEVVIGSKSASTFKLMYGNAIRAQLYEPTSQGTIFEIDAPSASPQESTLALVRDFGSGNRQGTDWTNEDFGVDAFTSINSWSDGNKKTLPIVLRGWDQDDGPIHIYGTPLAFFDTSGATALGSYASSTGHASNKYSRDVVLQIASSTATKLFTIDAAVGTNRLTALGSGYVGIGTSTPNALLDVAGSYPNIKVKNTNVTQYAGAGLMLLNNITSMGTQGGTVLYSGINDNSATPGQGYFSIDQSDTNGTAGNRVLLADYNANTLGLYTGGVARLTISPGGAINASSTMHVTGAITVGSCTGCNTGTSTSMGLTGRLTSTYTATSSWLGSNTFANASSKCIICVTPSGSVGTANAAVGEGAIIVDNTLNTQSPGLYISSDQAGTPDNPIAIIRSTSASMNQGQLWLLGSSSNTNGGAFGVKIQDANPDLEFIESDQVGTDGTGKYEIDGNNDLIRINGRNAANNSFDTFAWFARNDKGTTGGSGEFCVGCTFSYAAGGRIQIVASSTPGIPYITAGTAAGTADIFTINRKGGFNLGTASSTGAGLWNGRGSLTASKAVTTGRFTATSSVFLYNLPSEASGDDSLCVGDAGKVSRGTTGCLTSSLRFKDNIRPLNVGLAELLKLNPVSYTYKGTTKERIGLIAEDVLKIEPRLVGFEPDEKTPRSVSYEETVPLLIQSIKELNAKVESLEERIKLLEKK